MEFFYSSIEFFQLLQTSTNLCKILLEIADEAYEIIADQEYNKIALENQLNTMWNRVRSI